MGSLNFKKHPNSNLGIGIDLQLQFYSCIEHNSGFDFLNGLVSSCSLDGLLGPFILLFAKTNS